MSGGTFEIQEILGSDDISVVCTARERADDLPGRLVALKVIKQTITKQSVLARAYDEARMLGRLRHPNVVHVFRVHTFHRRPVIEMEVVRGVSLQTLLERHPDGLPVDAVLKIARRVAHALEAAWERPDGPDGRAMRIIHRNIKPSNVMVSIDGIVKVTDFILAKGSFPDRQAMSISLPPALQHLTAPEVGLVDTVTPAADVYMLGAMIYQLITGETLNVLPVAATHDEQCAERLQVLQPEWGHPVVIERLKELIWTMMAFDAEQRPTHRVVAEVIEDVLESNDAPHGLRDFCRSFVKPAWAAREVLPPREHPEYGEIAFLEAATPDSPKQRGEMLTAQQVERRVWRTVSMVGWPNQLADLQELIFASGHRPVRPFLAVLDRAEVPGWKFWSREATPEELKAALSVFAQDPPPDILTRARGLLGHSDQEVAQAARYILSRAKKRRA